MRVPDPQCGNALLRWGSGTFIKKSFLLLHVVIVVLVVRLLFPHHLEEPLVSEHHRQEFHLDLMLLLLVMDLVQRIVLL